MSTSVDSVATYPATVANIERAARLLGAGELVVFPTETVYGLGGDARNARATARIFEAKGRPQFNPLIAHYRDRSAAFEDVEACGLAQRLADAFWPGPLTLVLGRTATCSVCDLVSAGLPTLAVRVPGSQVARRLLNAVPGPIAAPSANPSGRISPTRAEHALRELRDRVAMVLDGGPCDAGVESTIVAVSNGHCRILRPGSITRQAIAELVDGALSPSTDTRGDDHPISPGQLLSHYAPRARVRLNVTTPLCDEAALDFAGQLGHCRPRNGYADLSPQGDLREAAANLFATLRQLDSMDIGTIAVAPIPDHGLGEAINDRLTRAAAPRDNPA